MKYFNFVSVLSQKYVHSHLNNKNIQLKEFWFYVSYKLCKKNHCVSNLDITKPNYKKTIVEVPKPENAKKLF